MMKNLIYLVKLITIFVIPLASSLESEDRISDKRLCGDLQCSVPLSIARAAITYSSDDSRILSFRPGDMLTIYSKSAGKRPDLWGAELRGKRGYVPKNLIQEMKVMKSDPVYEVPTAEAAIQEAKKVDTPKDAPATVPDEQPANEQGPMYVIDGTTLYMPEDSSMQMTTNVESLPTTSAPETNKPEEENASQETSVDHTASVASPEEVTTDSNPIDETTTERGDDTSSSVPPPSSNENTIDSVETDKEVKESEEVLLDYVEPEVTIGDSDSENKSEEVDSGSVYDYLSDTLTGWMSGDGGESEEEEEEEEENEDETDSIEDAELNKSKEITSDTGQENIPVETTTAPTLSENNQEENDVPQKIAIEVEPENSIEYSSIPIEEVAPQEPQVLQKIEELPVSESSVPPEIVLQNEQPVTMQPGEEVDLSKINLLSLKPSSMIPNKQIHSAEVNTLKVDNQVLEKTQQDENNLIDEINFQGQPADPVHVPKFSYFGAPSKIQDNLPQETITNENGVKHPEEKQAEQESVEAEASESITPSSDADLEPPEIEDVQTTTTAPEESDAPTPSPIFYEPSPTELPSQEESEAPRAQEDFSTIDESNNSDTKDSEENTTTETKTEVSGTFEEITTTTTSPIVEEVEPVEESSGGLFASWVYTLFGYSTDEEEEKSDDVKVAEEVAENISSEVVEEPAVASSSWWSWGSSDSSVEQVPPQQACNAESGELGCEDIIGSDPRVNQEETVTPSSLPHHHDKSAEEATVATMDWEAVASSDKTILLVITAVTVLFFTLGYYFIEKTKKDGILIAKINALQKELLIASKECLMLKDDLDMTKEMLTGAETTSTGSSEEVLNIKLELDESQSARADLEEQVISLEKELEAATEAGLELNKMLSEFLSAQKGSEDLTKSVELLQQQLNKQQATISTMNQALTAKAQEAEEVQSDLLASQDKVTDLETELAKVTERLEEVQKQKQHLTEDLEESCVTLANQLQEAAQLREAEVCGLKQQLEASETRLKEVEESLRTRSSELEVLQASLAKVQILKGGDSKEGQKKLQALIDVGKAQAELKLITSERDVLKERLQCEEDARQLLEDHVKVICVEVEKLRERHEVAEKEKQEAQTKLDVLSSYFKEKETQLQKELGLQEAMCEQKKEDVSVTHVRIKTLQEEIETYKTQNETLKQEIVEQERSLKGQITTLEKKAHENWIAARQAERKLDETKQEAGTLRNRLTLLEKGPVVAQNGEESKQVQRLDANGELLPISPMLHIGDSPSMSPPHLVGAPAHYMMMPPPPPPTGSYLPQPPPPEYLHSPPPPLPLYPDRRPPPLGRMSSPPPHHFSPPPDRYSSPYRPRSPASDRSLPRYRYSSRSPSPPPYGHPDYAPYPPAARHWEEPRAGFRPLHRDKEPKGSTLSSGHSSESLEKSSRHSGGKS